MTHVHALLPAKYNDLRLRLYFHHTSRLDHRIYLKVG